MKEGHEGKKNCKIIVSGINLIDPSVGVSRHLSFNQTK
jgi:hypothetical protein